MSGYNGSDFFGPYNELTRAETATILGRLAGVNVAADDSCNSNGGFTTPFADVDGGAWYAKAVAWAVEQGFIGKGGTVDAQGTITRGMPATIVARFMDAYDLTTEVADTLADGEDGGDIVL